MKSWLMASVALMISTCAAGDVCAQTTDNDAHARRAQVRQACQADLQKFCADVQAGGGRIFKCIREHKADLSDSCKSAMASARAERQKSGPPPQN